MAPKDVKEFTVSRKTWHRGGITIGPCVSPSLLTRCGEYCILGSYIHSCGVDDEHLLNKYEPNELFSNKIYVPDWLLSECEYEDDYYLNSRKADKIMSVNDSPIYSDAEREKLLKELFAEQDIVLTFVD